MRIKICSLFAKNFENEIYPQNLSPFWDKNRQKGLAFLGCSEWWFFLSPIGTFCAICKIQWNIGIFKFTIWSFKGRIMNSVCFTWNNKEWYGFCFKRMGLCFTWNKIFGRNSYKVSLKNSFMLRCLRNAVLSIKPSQSPAVTEFFTGNTLIPKNCQNLSMKT